MEIEESDYQDSRDASRGERGEAGAKWYFRLNGFFLIDGFIVHPDRVRLKPRTEADLLGIRLKYSSEGVWRTRRGDKIRGSTNRTSMTDYQIITDSATIGTVKKSLIAMVEVKAGRCSINGPWSDVNELDSTPGNSNMERALARVGFGNQNDVKQASRLMYENLRYEGQDFIVQYFSVGKLKNPQLQIRYPQLIQIDFKQIANFLVSRFHCFPEKIPQDREIIIWKGFGYDFMRWFEEKNFSKPPSILECEQAVLNYIESGYLR